MDEPDLCLLPVQKNSGTFSCAAVFNEGGDSEWFINYPSISIREKCVESMSKK